MHVLQRGRVASLIQMGDVAQVGDVCGCRDRVGIPIPVLMVGLPVFGRLVESVFELASELVGFVLVSLGSGSASRVFV